MNLRLTLFSLLLTVRVCSADPGAPVTPFNGKDLSGWEVKKKDSGENKWVVGEPAVSPDNPATLTVKPGGTCLINATASHGQSFDLFTTAKWGDITLEVEVMVPKGSNSGIYLMGEYEVQIFDSYGKTTLDGGDMGAIYGAQVPPVNASKAPGEWQKYVIRFQAPRFDAGGRKTANAKFIRVELNGKVLHENVEVAGPTLSCLTGKESATGPLLFQGDHGPVAWRNLRITPENP